MAEGSSIHRIEPNLNSSMENFDDFSNNYRIALDYFHQKDYYKAASYSLKAYKIAACEKKNIQILITSLVELSMFKEASAIAEQFIKENPNDECIKEQQQKIWNCLSQEYEKETYLSNVINQIAQNSKFQSATGNSNKKKKILHIGGAHTTHLRDLLTEINRRPCFSQVIVSPTDREMSKLLEEYPFYKVDYGISDKFTANISDKTRYHQIKAELKTILNHEKPDIIHVHSLSAAVAVKAIREFSTIPIFINPWNILRIYNQNGIVYELEQEALSVINKFIVPVKEAFDKYQSIYCTLREDKWLQSGYIVEVDRNFKRNINHISPKILCARQVDEKYHQHLLIESIPDLITKYPQLRVTLMRGPNVEQGVEYFDYVTGLINRLGVSEYCSIINESVSYNDFYEMIKAHNIIYSIYELDMGYSVTNILGITSGAAILSDDSPIKNLPLLKNGKNIFKTSINQKSIQTELNNIISDLPKVLNTIINNNKEFFLFDKEVLMPNLYSAYLEI